MLSKQKIDNFFRYANQMTVKELKETSKNLLLFSDFNKVLELNKKSEVIDFITFKILDLRYNIPLRLKHDYITDEVVEECESLHYFTDVNLIDGTRKVLIFDARPYFYLGSVRYETGKELPKILKKIHNILARSNYRYLIGGYDIYVAKKEKYNPYK